VCEEARYSTETKQRFIFLAAFLECHWSVTLETRGLYALLHVSHQAVLSI